MPEKKVVAPSTRFVYFCMFVATIWPDVWYDFDDRVVRHSANPISHPISDNMKHALTILFFIFVIVVCRAQSPEQPFVWLRADSAYAGDMRWRDVSGHRHDALPPAHNMPSRSLNMNFNPCFDIPRGARFKIPFDSMLGREADVIVVYETADTSVECGLWMLGADSGARMGLTSKRILSERGDVTYDTPPRAGAVINYLSQTSAPDGGARGTAQDPPMMCIATADTMPFAGTLPEFMFFNRHMGRDAVTQWISYLAIKYGITLFRTNYLDSRMRRVWDYDTMPEYSFSIAGIGRDSVMGLYQKQTFFADNHIVFGLGDMAESNGGNPMTMSDGDFIVMGMDSAGLSARTVLRLCGGSLSVTGRSVVQTTGTGISSYRTFLRLDTSFAGLTSPAIVIDRSGTGEYPQDQTEIIRPDGTDSTGNVFFHNLHWDTDGGGTDAFCIALDLPSAESDGKSKAVANGENVSSNETSTENSFLLTPNPTSGQYRLEISLSEVADVSVVVSTADGKTVGTFSGRGGSHYVFNGSASVAGMYLVDVRCPLEHRTMKLLVQ